jgi:hypothetical protein
MKYIITENRLIEFVDKYIQDSVGTLRKFPIDSINARDDDFELVDDGGNSMFIYLDYHLGIDNYLFNTMRNLFDLNVRQTEELLESWFKKHYPGNMVITAYSNY